MTNDASEGELPNNISFWWHCVESNAELSGEEIRDEDVVLHFCASGATAMVYAKDFRDLLKTRHGLSRDEVARLVEIALDNTEDVINEYHSNYFSRGNPLERHIDGMKYFQDQFTFIQDIKKRLGM